MSSLHPAHQLSIEGKRFDNDQEEQASTGFTTANMKFFHNLMVSTAMDKINLPVDPSNPNVHALDSEFLRGRLSAIQEIMAYAHPAGTPN